MKKSNIVVLFLFRIFLLNARYKGLIQTQGFTKNFPCKKPSGSNNKKKLRAGGE